MQALNESGWRGRMKPLLPPLLLNLYRNVRYGRTHHESLAGDQSESKAAIKDVQFDLPSRALNALFPGIESIAVTVLTSELYRPRDMVLPLVDILTLAAVTKHFQPQRVFEIGTYSGSSTLAVAMNAPRQTEVFTLDLDESEIVGSCYRGTPWAGNVRQIFGDSRTFDYGPFEGNIDLVLVDANHEYDFVKSDSEKAFRMVRRGGVIIWDDYLWLECHSECAGVTVCLNELQQRYPVFQIAGTRLAVYIDNMQGA